MDFAPLACEDVFTCIMLMLNSLQSRFLLFVPRLSVSSEFKNPGGIDVLCRDSSMIYELSF